LDAVEAEGDLGAVDNFLVVVVVADKYVSLGPVGVVVTEDELLVLSLLFSTTLQDLTEVDEAEVGSVGRDFGLDFPLDEREWA
jgi:hypothetical protein